MRETGAATLLALSLAAFPAGAGDVDILGATATKGQGSWRFDVTLSHEDEGWEHYADAWRVVGPDGTVYGTRELAHPHVHEQPFTRSLSGVVIPEDVSEVAIEAHDSRHGWSADRIVVSLTR